MTDEQFYSNYPKLQALFLDAFKVEKEATQLAMQLDATSNDYKEVVRELKKAEWDRRLFTEMQLDLIRDVDICKQLPGILKPKI
jgi:hypothetical protein